MFPQIKIPAQMTAAEMMRLNMRIWTLWGEASAVIMMRMCGMAGVWQLPSDEMTSMLTEKAKAFSAAAEAGAAAAFSGKGAEKIGTAALAPILRKARSNRKRLSRAGPKLGL